MTGNPTIDLILLVLLALIVTFVIISQLRSVQAVAVLLIELVLVPVRVIHELLVTVTDGLLAVTRDLFKNAVESPHHERPWRAFFAVIFYVLLFLMFLVPESMLVLMALQGAGLVPADLVIPGEVGVLTAISFLSLGIYWGATFLDTAKGAFYHPWNELPALRWSVCALSLVAAVVALYMAVMVGAYRGYAVTEQAAPVQDIQLAPPSFFSGEGAVPAVPPLVQDPAAEAPVVEELLPFASWLQGLEQRVPIQLGMLLMGLTMLALFTVEWSIRPTMVYITSLASALMAIILWPFRLIVGIVHEMIGVVGRIVDSMLDLVHRTGSQVTRIRGDSDLPTSGLGAAGVPRLTPDPATVVPTAKKSGGLADDRRIGFPSDPPAGNP